MTAAAPHRRTALVVLVVGGAVAAGLAWALVPWNPVPGGPLSPVPASSVLTPEQIARAEDFSDGARLWSRMSLVAGPAAAVLLGLTPIGRRLVGRLPGPWWARVLLAVAAVGLAQRLVSLPADVMLRRQQRAFGLSTQPWAGFVRDQAVGTAVQLVATGLAVLLLVACARRWRRAWPAVAGAALAGLVLVVSWLYPLVVEPLFSRFEPLPEGTLRTQILQLADEEGVEVGDVLVADASRRTTTLNAYVSGFGGSRRVVVYDNLVEDLPEEQTLSVVAHELAHARHDDVLVGSAIGAAGAGAAVGLLGLLLGRRRLDDPATVPFVLAVVAVGTVLAMPVQNTLSRQIETRADVEALQTTGDAAAFTAMQRELARRSLADPTPAAWSQLWFGSHPTVLERTALAERVAAS